jgi:hypothetical protein
MSQSKPREEEESNEASTKRSKKRVWIGFRGRSKLFFTVWGWNSNK